MHVIKRKTLKEFWQKHPDSEQAIRTWYSIVIRSKWNEPSDIKRIFANADFLQNNRVCFNLKGTKYRLIVKVIYELQRVYVRFIGTHAEYDKIDANKI
ncbi:MAG TPA: type II toxin-antitoxin system HigB family toxin [Thermodesulfovibrionia bacterium]|nr:type II toxin-antitoxin system HigB family toxin [Thermodesulfovibrionia bacterium]